MFLGVFVMGVIKSFVPSELFMYKVNFCKQIKVYTLFKLWVPLASGGAEQVVKWNC